MVRIFAPASVAALCLAIAGGALFAAETKPAEYDLEILSQQLPARVHEHDLIELPLLLRNRGSVDWDPAKGFNVSYHWLSSDGAPLVWDGERTPLPAVVRSGEKVAVKARLRVPRGAGDRLLQWDVVHESVTWVSERDPTPAESIRLSILAGRVTHAFSVLEAAVPRLLRAGTTRMIRVVIRNDGTEAWPARQATHLSYHWHHRDAAKAVYDSPRTVLPRRVAPGEQIALEAWIEVPSRPGLYRMQWDMVEEHVVWFSERDPSAEPRRLVLVVVPLPPAAGAFLVALACLGLAALAWWRPALPAPLVAVASVADVIWLAAALLIKQQALLESGAHRPVTASLWLASVAVIALAIAVALLPRRMRPWSALAINAVISVLLLAELMHLRFFGDVVSMATARSAVQIGDVLASAAALATAQDLWFLLDLLPGIALAVAVRALLLRRSPIAARRLAFLLLLLLLPGLAAAWRVRSEREGPAEQVFQNVFVAQHLGLLNYHVRDVWLGLRARLMPPELSPQRRAEIERWFRANAPRRAGVAPWLGAARGKNLLMLQVESLQSFVVGMVVNGQEVTPTLNRLRRSQNAWFAECSDQTIQGRTSDSEFSTQVSLLPSTEGAVAFRYGTNRYFALADILAERGYRSLSAVPFDAGFWNRRVTHREYGFRTRYFGDSFAAGTAVGWGLNDRDFLLQMVPRLAALRAPFAALLITLSNHHPFGSFPSELKRLDLGRLEGTPLGNYLHSVHHFDAALAELLAALEQRGLARRTLIAVWGDHGAGFPWNAQFAAAIGRRPTEADYYLAEKVPVLLLVPEAAGPLPAMNGAPCGQIDLAPTLLALLGIDPARYPFLGRNLLGHPGDAPVVQRYGVWSDRELLYLPKGPELEDGLCHDLPTLRRLPPSRCAEGYRQSRLEMQISRDVIEHDLQTELAKSLEQRP